MLPETPWKSDVVVRLFVSVLLCIFIGAVVGSGIGFLRQEHQGNTLQYLIASAGAIGCFAGGLVLLNRPWAFQGIVKKMLGLMACVYGGFFLMWWAMRLQGGEAGLTSPILSTVIRVLSFQGATALLVHVILRQHGATWSSVFGFRDHPARALLLGSVAGLVIAPIGWSMQKGSVLLFKRLFNLDAPQQELVRFLQATEPWSERLVFGMAAILVAPLGEELLFRGVLYPTIKKAGFPQLALWLTALLFGLVHMTAATFLPLTLLALVLVWLYERTGNLLAPVAAHAAFNAVNFIVLYSPWLQEKLDPFL